MPLSRSQVRIGAGFVNAAGRSLLAGTAVLLLLGAAQVARAEKDCPPECVACNAKPKCVWHNSFCFCEINAEVTVLSDVTAEDPVLT